MLSSHQALVEKPLPVAVRDDLTSHNSTLWRTRACAHKTSESVSHYKAAAYKEITKTEQIQTDRSHVQNGSFCCVWISPKKMSHRLWARLSQSSACLVPTQSSVLNVLLVSRWGQESAPVSAKPNICLHLNLTHNHGEWTKFTLLNWRMWKSNIGVVGFRIIPTEQKQHEAQQCFFQQA